MLPAVAKPMVDGPAVMNPEKLAESELEKGLSAAPEAVENPGNAQTESPRPQSSLGETGDFAELTGFIDLPAMDEALPKPEVVFCFDPFESAVCDKAAMILSILRFLAPGLIDCDEEGPLCDDEVVILERSRSLSSLPSSSLL